MIITVHNNGKYKDVSINVGNTTCDLGLLDKKEVKELVEVLMSAVQELIED